MQARTEIELGPKSRMQVTLFDANHCPGAVMFLFEADNNAVVYTGDIRAEPWWVNSMVQNPIFLPYISGIKKLDCLYLDTTFATHDEPYNRFPTKAEGLLELTQKVKQCPPDTLFYFRSWTLGYENVWVALSDALNSRVHVDEYQVKLLGSGLSTEQSGFLEGPALTGFALGNTWHRGCLTKKNDDTIKIHSCEPGTPCHSKIKKLKNVVWISPIISRLKDGVELRELGAGGGWGDLYQNMGLAFDDFTALQQFGAFCQGALKDDINPETIQKKIEEARKLRRYNLTLEGLEDILSMDDEKNVSLQDLREALSKAPQWLDSLREPSVPADPARPNKDNAARTIHFPYSRHSSYGELRHLVDRFRPKDICPCTVDPEGWTEDMSMESLFGDLCSEETFFYDDQVRSQVKSAPELPVSGKKRKRGQQDSQETASQESENEQKSYRSAKTNATDTKAKDDDHQPHEQQGHNVSSSTNTEQRTIFKEIDRGDKIIVIDSDSDPNSDSDPGSDKVSMDLSTFDGIADTNQGQDDEPPREENDIRRQARIEAYRAAKRCLNGNDTTEWNWYPLRSAGRKGHEEEEEEL